MGSIPVNHTNTSLLETSLTLLQKICTALAESDKDKSLSADKIFNRGIGILLTYLFGQCRNTINQFEKQFLYTQDDFVNAVDKTILTDIRNQYATLALNIDTIPDLYGKLIRYTVQRSNNVIVLKTGQKGRNEGIYYTPSEITSFIVHETIAPLVDNRSLQELKRIRVCDPAMGTGAFLRQAAWELTNTFVEKFDKKTRQSWDSWYRFVVKNCIYGIDKDETAVKITRVYFAHSAGIELDELKHFIVGDSLLSELPDNWNFDAVFGNPPWVSFGLRGVKRISLRTSRQYRKRFPETAEYKLSVYALFIEQALKMTVEGGYHGFIVPDSWLMGRYFSKLRSFLIASSTFQHLLIIKNNFWTGPHVGRCTVYVVKKGKPAGISGSIPADIITNPENLQSGNNREIQLSLTRIGRRSRHRIVVYPDENSQKIAEWMEDCGDVLGNHIRFYSGLIGKKGKQSIVITHGFNNHSMENCGKLIESGKNLSPNSVTFTGCHIVHQRGIYKSGYDVEKYENPKLFVNQTGYDLKACYDDRGFYCLNNLHIAYPVHDHTDLRFYAALLNSRILNFYYKIMSMEHGRALAQTDIDFLLQLPHGKNDKYQGVIQNLIEQNSHQNVVCHSDGSITYSWTIPEEIQKEMDVNFIKWYTIPSSFANTILTEG